MPPPVIAVPNWEQPTVTQQANGGNQQADGGNERIKGEQLFRTVD
jgi:hypothetical protein